MLMSYPDIQRKNGIKFLNIFKMKKASELLKERYATFEIETSEDHKDTFAHKAYMTALKGAIEVIELWEKLEKPYKDE